MDPMTCAELAESSAELALGILPGPERARALEHLQGCMVCRLVVEHHAEVVDALVELAPAVEPPLGFDTRIVRCLLPRHGRRRRRLRRTLATAALASLALVSLVLGTRWIAQQVGHGATTPGAPVSAELHDGPHDVGRVYLYRGTPGWVFMTLDARGTTGPVSCVLTWHDGTSRPVGTFTLSGGYGSWAAPVPGAGTVTAARVVDAVGRVVAQASLPTR